MNNSENKIRLHKFMSRTGLASLRKCEKFILEGRVKINGNVADAMGILVDPELDEILFDDMPLKTQREKSYFALHKPRGYLTTLDDPSGRPTVNELIDKPYHIYPVGRLDMDSEGLLIVTNDGDLAQKLLRPEMGFEKEYVVFIKGIIDDKSLERLRNGMDMGAYFSRPAIFELLDQDRDWQRWQVILYEGKKRQIRRMLLNCGHRVLRLVRIRIGPIWLNDLKPGCLRPLEADELESLGVQS